ncbi:MAG: adenosylmethionine-8-amino-7-oxononanoate aminotransferase, partial [Mariprofundus sp.]|nr:adenosylmethionine-8-amino-7-oxononanoate aminotransferase [Mariprofundus sp.]
AYAIVTDGDVADPEHHAMVHVNVPTPSFTPSAFSSAGVAPQYRMVLTGSVDVTRQEKTIWQSGNIQRRGDVFVTGGPTSIEASRERLLKDLSRQWLNDAVSRLRSGF